MPEHFTFLGNQELNGILRGRSVASARSKAALKDGLTTPLAQSGKSG